MIASAKGVPALALLLGSLLVASCGGATSNTGAFDTLVGNAAGSSAGSESETGPGVRLDVLSHEDLESDTDECGEPSMEGDGELFSVIWIANSTQGTVSKVDTVTATEIARYRTGPGFYPDPSRTSVNLDGEVAVANRSGSVIKIAAGGQGCVDANGNGSIRTSSGPDDVLDWGDDECVAWYHHTGFDTTIYAYQGGPRAVAWDAGTETEDGCSDAKVWVGWRDQPDETTIIRRLDGRTGEPDGEVVIADWTQTWGHGVYGGATDADRNFWGLGTAGTLVRVEAETFAVTRWDNPEPGRTVYGIALDDEGNPWLGGWEGTLWRFDVETETWEDLGQPGDGTRLRGLAIDPNGQAWLAQNTDCALVRYDMVARETVAGHIELPGCKEPVGVSIDADGFVWVVDFGADMAFKVDPQTYDIAATLTELVNPYTYSDMTGVGLNVAANPGIG